MLTHFSRDHAMYTAIFGFFAMMWFGMAQENPPKSWRHWLWVGSAVATTLSLAGIYLAITNWHAASALTDKNAFITFGIVVATEITAIAVGSIVLAKKRKHQYIAAWMAFVVGAHFAPLALLFKDDWLYLLTALVCAAPVVGIVLAKKTKVSISAVTAVITGLTLLAFSLRGLILFLAK